MSSPCPSIEKRNVSAYMKIGVRKLCVFFGAYKKGPFYLLYMCTYNKRYYIHFVMARNCCLIDGQMDMSFLTRERNITNIYGFFFFTKHYFQNVAFWFDRFISLYPLFLYKRVSGLVDIFYCTNNSHFSSFFLGLIWIYTRAHQLFIIYLKCVVFAYFQIISRGTQEKF